MILFGGISTSFFKKNPHNFFDCGIDFSRRSIFTFFSLSKPIFYPRICLTSKSAQNLAFTLAIASEGFSREPRQSVSKLAEDTKIVCAANIALAKAQRKLPI